MSLSGRAGPAGKEERKRRTQGERRVERAQEAGAGGGEERDEAEQGGKDTSRAYKGRNDDSLLPLLLLLFLASLSAWNRVCCAGVASVEL